MRRYERKAYIEVVEKSNLRVDFFIRPRLYFEKLSLGVPNFG